MTSRSARVTALVALAVSLYRRKPAGIVGAKNSRSCDDEKKEDDGAESHIDTAAYAQAGEDVVSHGVPGR
jgi:hypothetical protein